MTDSPRNEDRAASPPVHPSRRDAVPGKDRSRSPRRRGGDGDNRTDSYRPSGGRDRDRNWDRDDDRRDRDRDRDGDRRDRDRDRDRPRRGGGGFKYKEKRRDEDRDDRDGGRRDRGRERGYRNRSPRRDGREQRGRDGEKPKRAAPAPAAAVGEEMIVVNVNDRLGTKAAIPCLLSDTVKGLKMMVAARIGRKPHEILLKRQGERPFKDHLTLDEYGISNGVQLDLEVDTGD